MRYRLASLSLVAVLGVLCWRTTLPAGPAEPIKRLPPHALVYVGLGKNNPDNSKRIDTAVNDLRCYGPDLAVCDAKVNALPIVQEREKELGGSGRKEWARSKTRAASVGGTAVILVSFADGSPEEQVAIVNAIADAYVKKEKGDPVGDLKLREQRIADFRAARARAGLPFTEKDERAVEPRREWIENRPYVIEWAKLPEKP
jgi:hypothetical protein